MRTALGGLVLLAGLAAWAAPPTSLATAAGPPSAWLTDRGTIRFRADTPMVAIDATSTRALFIYDGQGAFVGSVALSSFEFSNGLLKSHFNESYVESQKPGAPDAQGQPTFPNQLAVVSGRLIAPLDVSRDGTTEVELKGRLTCHGIPREQSFRGTVTVTGGQMKLSVRFNLAPDQYGIPLPTVGDAPMFRSVEVTVEGTLGRQSG